MNHFFLGFGDELEKIAVSKKKLLLAALGLGGAGYLYKNREKQPMSELEKMMRSKKKLTAVGGGKLPTGTGIFHPKRRSASQLPD